MQNSNDIAFPPHRAALVVAHPDDESLWFSSVLSSVDRIVFCFGDQFGESKKAAARRRAVSALPLQGLLNLALPESGTRFFVDWARPQLTQFGIAITDPAACVRYEDNYGSLIEGLRTALAGCDAVHTHNPWGEYGHPDHIQVYRAVTALQAELGYTIWFTNYAGAASWPLVQQIAGQPCWAQRRAVRPDTATARALMRVYARNGAWTWTRAHRWPAEEMLYAQPCSANLQPRLPLSGEWLLDVAGLRWWPPPWRGARRQLLVL
ncbi:MAG: PIG-L family deacetylase [Proteobacteria bacterium]|nr:PIG-L family deacetylase [Pseudomonadota bacterium]